jgi:hypothetical protein
MSSNLVLVKIRPSERVTLVSFHNHPGSSGCVRPGSGSSRLRIGIGFEEESGCGKSGRENPHKKCRDFLVKKFQLLLLLLTSAPTAWKFSELPFGI